MAELRRVGGRLESHRRPRGPRALLPAEVELCETLGINEQEYWTFVDAAAEYVHERSEEYELIPDVRNEPATVAIVLTVIGIALQAAAYLLAPKPRSPEQKERPQLQEESVNGRTRFTPTNNFSSVQELAKLGETVPLIYAKRGVRANGLLVWSNLVAYGAGQQLRAVMLLSSGTIGKAPDFESFAIGDSLLENYNKRKFKLYFRDGSNDSNNRLRGADSYAETRLDVPAGYAFDLVNYRDPKQPLENLFSGTRTPGTQAVFGLYSPVPNFTVWKLPYELVMTPSGSDDKVSNNNRTKSDKIAEKWATRAGISEGDLATVTYLLNGDLQDVNRYGPWGSTDAREGTKAARVRADEIMTVGEQYMIGNQLAVCTEVKGDAAGQPWGADDNGTQLKVQEKEFTLRFLDAVDEDDYDKGNVNGKFEPYERRTVQRVAIGTVTNNVACQMTEICVKSTVWKRINGFPLMNGHPSVELIDDYESRGGNIQLGTFNGYVNRWSFFTLEAREISANDRNNTDFKKISEYVFAVRGRSPVAQYNMFRIAHPEAYATQQEFRFVPYSGAEAYRNLKNEKVIWLNDQGNILETKGREYTVFVRGYIYTLTEARMSNTEWIKGPPPSVSERGEVEGLSSYKTGSVPIVGWEFDQDRDFYTYNQGQSIGDGVEYKNGKYYFYWGRTFQGTSTTNEYIKDGNKKFVRTAKVDNNRYNISRYFLSTEEKEPNGKDDLSPASDSGSGLVLRVTWWDNGAAEWKIKEAGSGYKNGEEIILRLGTINSSLKSKKVTISVVNTKAVDAKSFNEYDAITDYWKYDAESTSHQDNAEHEIVAVNEIRTSEPRPTYPSLAMMGIRINASSELNQFSNLSAFVKEGIKVQALINEDLSERKETADPISTNLFPEIAYDLMTSEARGAARYIGADQVDREELTVAAKFCQANNLFWDGTINKPQNLREFFFEMAAYHMLDFKIVGGQFSLYPSVAFNPTSYKRLTKVKPSIKALFTDGNVRDMQVTFLQPEERQLFRGTAIWREDAINGFPRNRVYSAYIKNGGSKLDPEEVFDMSGFCTSEEHAKTFVHYALMLRKYVDHSVQFQTTPQAAMTLQPGDYFRFVSHSTHTNRFDNGSIGPDGTIQSSTPVQNGATIMYWNVGSQGVNQTTINVSDGKTSQQNLWNSVFTQVTAASTNRVYKCESLTYADDGLVEIAGTHMELNSEGQLRYLDWDDSSFVSEVG